MSHIEIARCPACNDLVSSGWTEPGLGQRAFCTACDADLFVDAFAEQGPDPRPALRLAGKVVGTAPVRLIEAHGDLWWQLDLVGVPCPACGAPIVDLHAALHTCRRCGAGMESVDPP